MVCPIGSVTRAVHHAIAEQIKSDQSRPNQTMAGHRDVAKQSSGEQIKSEHRWGQKGPIESEQIKIISEETTGHSRSNRISADNRAAQNRRRSGNSKSYNIRANNRSKQITSEQLKIKKEPFKSNQSNFHENRAGHGAEQGRGSTVRGR